MDKTWTDGYRILTKSAIKGIQAPSEPRSEITRTIAALPFLLLYIIHCPQISMEELLSVSRIDEDEWDRHKEVIISLYLGTSQDQTQRTEEGEDHTKGQTLKKLAESMRVMHGFNASASQIEAKLKTWGVRKNLKPQQWVPILETLDSLPRGTRSRVIISGRVIPDSSIYRARRYYNHKRRTVGNLSAIGSSRSSPLPPQVRIEIQRPDGRWVEPSGTVTTPTAGVPYSPRADVLGELHAAQLSALSPAPALGTGPTSAVWGNHSSLRNGISNVRLFEYDGRPTVYQLSCPSTWIQTLPSRVIRAAMLASGLNGVTLTRRIKQAEHAFISVKDLTSGEDSLFQQLMSPADVCRFKFTEFLLSIITNGMCRPEEIPEQVLDGVIGHSGAVNSLLLRCCKDLPFLRTAIVSAFFEALMLKDKRNIIAQLFDKGFFHANDSIIFDEEGIAWTPLERAANAGEEALMELLLSHEADPNKTYRLGTGRFPVGRGALLSFLTARDSDGRVRKYRPSLEILRKLFEKGAENFPGITDDILIPELDEIVASEILLHIKPSHHEMYFTPKFCTSVIAPGEDLVAAHLVGSIISDCAEQHESRCILRFQTTIHSALVAVAKKGHVKTFQALWPHYTHSSDERDVQLLCAAIRGNQSDIIDFVMSKRPDINPPPVEVERGVGSTPVAEAIRARNAEFIEYFANTKGFKSLDGLGQALAATADIGDAELLVRLLDSKLDLEYRSLATTFLHAIEQDREDSVRELLGRGASFDPNFNSTRKSITDFAIQKGNKQLVQDLLHIGDTSLYQQDYTIAKISMATAGVATFLRLLYLGGSIVEDYLASSACLFRYHTMDKLTIKDFDPEWKHDNKEHKKVPIPHLLLPALLDKKVLDFLLGSKVATEEFLTTCLATAVSQNSSTIAQELIERGANAANEVVLACAIRWSPTIFPLLVEKINHQRPMVTKGLRTDVLKEAIQGGPSKAGLVSHLIESGLVDIFDTGRPRRTQTAMSRAEKKKHLVPLGLTPLGVAIRQGEFNEKFSCDTVELLLKHGCGPDSIVWFHNDELTPPINRTALLEAIGTGSQKLVNLLIGRGAQVNPELRHLVRRTPLQEVAARGDLEMVRLLIEHGADVNANPSIALGGTALQFAAIGGNCDVAVELMQRGADLYTPPSKIGGRWPIEGAAENGRLEMISLLWEAEQQTLCNHCEDNGFRQKTILRAMRLARNNGHIACRDRIAQLAELPVTAADMPAISPLYVDWPPPSRGQDRSTQELGQILQPAT
ncbi:ankyrin [Hypoxylon argillaceum]|nr:ankyrin [Hypoxylon argillaceum]